MKHSILSKRIVKLPANKMNAAAKIHEEAFKCIGQKRKDTMAILKNKNLKLIGCFLNKDLAGYAQYKKYDESIYITWMAVGEKYKNFNVGSALLDSVIADAKKLKAKMIFLDSRNRFSKAIILYLSRGFEIRGVNQGADGELMISMKKKL